jgi:nucleoside-diphosphate-sugar epimerase
VLTSSLNAVSERYDYHDGKVFTRNDWSDVEICDPYSSGKTLAEKAAWGYQSGLPIKDRFELVSINPGFIIGPNILTHKFSQGEIIKKVMIKKISKKWPRVKFPIVDVRDCAKAHLQALKVPDAAN